jgi:hypothetical protein
MAGTGHPLNLPGPYRRYWTAVTGRSLLDTRSLLEVVTGHPTGQRRYWTLTPPTPLELDAGKVVTGHPTGQRQARERCCWRSSELTPPIPPLLDTHSANTKRECTPPLAQPRYWPPTPLIPPIPPIPHTHSTYPADTGHPLDPPRHAHPRRGPHAHPPPIPDTYSTYPAGTGTRRCSHEAVTGHPIGRGTGTFGIVVPRAY